MLLERPLSLKLIFHYYNQINRQRGRIIWMRDVLTNFLCFLFLFSFSLYCFCSWSILVFFFFFISSSTLPSSFLFFPFFSRQSVHLFVARLFLFFSFYFFQFQHFSLSSLCRVVMLKTVVYGNQVNSESLKNSAGTGTKLICYIVICWFMQKYTYICWIHTDTIIIKTPDDKDTGINDAHRKTSL